mgnify:CR=1
MFRPPPKDHVSLDAVAAAGSIRKAALKGRNLPLPAMSFVDSVKQAPNRN